jgi:hypothetical protein
MTKTTGNSKAYWIVNGVVYFTPEAAREALTGAR